MKEDKKLFEMVMGYFWECISTDGKKDSLINDLLEDFIKAERKPYFPDDLDITVLNLNNSQRRKLFHMMISSNIISITKEEIISEYCQ